MSTFYEQIDKPIASEMLRQGCKPELADVLQWTSYGEKERGAEAAFDLGASAISLVCACGVLAATGATLPLLAPLFTLAVSGVCAWNRRVAKQERELEAEFLHDRPDALALVSAHGDNAATLYDLAFKAWREGDAGRVAKVLSGAPVTGLLPPVTDAPELANSHEFPPTPTNSCQALNSELANTPTHANSCQTPDDMTVFHAHIHNHIPPSQPARAIATPTPAIPGPGRLQTEAPDLSLYADKSKRAMELMRAMAAAGMPIASILRHPFVMAIGGSQSGKTSFATVLALLRMATGCSVEYASVDDDIPEIGWAGVTGDPEGYVEAMSEVAEILSNANKGELKGKGWLFDEILRSAQEYGADITKLLIPCLTKGAKGGGLVVIVTHAKTVSAHNLKTGFAEAWERDRVAVEAIRERNEFGEYSPSGRYNVTIPGEQSQEWRWPEWMLNNLDPVNWVLERFPELKGKPMVQPQQKVEVESPLIVLDEPDPITREILRLLGERTDGMKPRDIVNYGRKPVRTLGVEAIKNELDRLVDEGLIQESEGTYYSP